MINIDAPAVYVGTYAKYNNGSIAGSWLNLTDYDQDTFNEKCREIHSDEYDPEIMFQDYQNFPRCFYSESGIDENAWQWLKLDTYDRDIVAAYLSQNSHDNMQDILDNCVGSSDSHNPETEYAEQYAADCMDIPDHLDFYIDYEKLGRDLAIDMQFIHYNNTTYIFNNF